MRAERTQIGAERRACYKVHGLQPAGGARTQARADPSALLRVRVAPQAYPRARSLRPVRPVLSIAAWHCGGFSQLRSCANQQRQPQPTNVAAELQRLRRLPQTAHRQCGRTVFSASVLLTGCAALSKERRASLGSVVPSQSIRRSSQLLPRLRQHSRTAWRARMGSREHRMAWPDGRRYMGTIGMAEIDYFVSDPQHIPPAYVEIVCSHARRLSHLVPHAS